MRRVAHGSKRSDPPAPSRTVDGPRARITDGLANVAAGLGTSRDKNFYNEYMPVVGLGQMVLENMFRGSWLARRIVSTPANDMTREWVSLSWEGKATDENGPKAIKKAEAQFGIKRKVNEAIRWGRLHGGAGIVIGIKNQDPAEPLDLATVKKDSLAYLRVFDRWRLTALTGQLDSESNANFGLPLFYMLDGSMKIHWSRVVRFGGDPLPYRAWLENQMWDDSVLQAPLSSVKAYDAVTGGIASMIWEANVDIIKTPGFFDYIGTKEGEAKLIQRFQAAATMKSFNRLLVMDKEEEYAQKTTQFSGVVATIGEFRNDLSGACGVPITRLWGNSASGLNATGEGDEVNYYDDIAGRQETDMIPQLTRIYDVVVPSTLGKMPEEFEIEANSLWQMSDKEKAELQKLRAERDQIYLDRGVITEGVSARQLRADGTYSEMTDEDVEMAEELAQEPEVAGPFPGQQPPGAPGSQPPGNQPPAPAGAKGANPSSQPPEDDDEEEEDDTPASDSANATVVERRVFQGFNIAVEHKAGSQRYWTDEAGREIGRVVMKHDYGFFEDHVGSDKQQLDVYLGPYQDAKDVFVVQQRKLPDYVSRDEDKVFLGFANPTDAKMAFVSHRHDGDAAYGGISGMSLAKFRKKLKDRKSTGPIRS
jgi:uncharacterized protein